MPGGDFAGGDTGDQAQAGAGADIVEIKRAGDANASNPYALWVERAVLAQQHLAHQPCPDLVCRIIVLGKVVDRKPGTCRYLTGVRSVDQFTFEVGQIVKCRQR